MLEYNHTLMCSGTNQFSGFNFGEYYFDIGYAVCSWYYSGINKRISLVGLSLSSIILVFVIKTHSNMASAMDVDDEEIELPTSSSSKGEKKRFEVKKVSTHNLNIIL